MEKVSCVMLTFNRYEHFERSFGCYCNQTYPNKELVIVCQGDEDYKAIIRNRVAESGRTDIRTVFVPPGTPLGTLRNVSIEESSGDLVCQWDDDDLNHPDRIATQLAALHAFGAQASYLLDHLHLFVDTKRIFWCDWVRSRGDLGHAGTMLAYRRSLPRYNPTLSFGEDSGLQRALFLQGARIALLRSIGYLYVYVYHGSNVFSRQHHQTLARWLGLERNTLAARTTTLCRTLRALSIDPPIEVVDHLEEHVFTWNGEENPTDGERFEQVQSGTMAFIVSRRKTGYAPPVSAVTGRAMIRRCEEIGLRVEECSRFEAG
jgi:glycosyltransferase involved in cell wall biosynthesis